MSEQSAEQPVSPRRRALSLIARYDQPGGDDCDRRVVRMARSWLSMTSSTRGARGRARRIMDELAHPPESVSCGWDEFRENFVSWALEQEIVSLADVPWADRMHGAGRL
jgi:hypothetical protein